jgi:hypothetical protein
MVIYDKLKKFGKIVKNNYQLRKFYLFLKQGKSQLASTS